MIGLQPGVRAAYDSISLWNSFREFLGRTRYKGQRQVGGPVFDIHRRGNTNNVEDIFQVSSLVAAAQSDGPNARATLAGAGLYGFRQRNRLFLPPQVPPRVVFRWEK